MPKTLLPTDTPPAGKVAAPASATASPTLAYAPRPVLFGLSKGAWLQIGLVAVAFAALYWPNLWRLWAKTNPIYGVDKDNWSHSVLVPVIGLYYLYLNRETLLNTPVKPLLAGHFKDNPARWIGGGVTLAVGLIGLLVLSLLGSATIGATMSLYASALLVLVAATGLLAILLDWGLGTLVCGMLLAAYGVEPGRNDYLKDMGMIMTLFGVVLTLGGWGVMRIAWFPIVFLICAVPWPGLVYSKIALPLQYLAAKVAFVVLNLFQIDTTIEGTTINMFRPGQDVRELNVAEACAGMRSLMPFITAGGAIGFVLGKRPMWHRIVIVFSAIPIAILCNTMRVSVQGLLDFYVSQELSEDFAHMFIGLVMLIPAFFMLLGVAWMLDQVFIEVDDDEPDDDTKRKGKPRKPNKASKKRPSSPAPARAGGPADNLVGGAA